MPNKSLTERTERGMRGMRGCAQRPGRQVYATGANSFPSSPPLLFTQPELSLWPPATRYQRCCVTSSVIRELPSELEIQRGQWYRGCRVYLASAVSNSENAGRLPRVSSACGDVRLLSPPPPCACSVCIVRSTVSIVTRVRCGYHICAWHFENNTDTQPLAYAVMRNEDE